MCKFSSNNNGDNGGDGGGGDFVIIRWWWRQGGESCDNDSHCIMVDGGVEKMKSIKILRREVGFAMIKTYYKSFQSQ